MKRILIADGRLCDIVLPGQEFPVAAPWFWADCPDDTTSHTHRWNGTTVEVIVIPLADKQATKIQEIMSRRALELVANIVVNGYTWQADEHSQVLITNAIQMNSLGLGLPAVWRTFDNINVTITSVQQLIDIAAAIKTRTEAIYYKSWTKKAEIEAATDLTIDAITWDSV